MSLLYTCILSRQQNNELWLELRLVECINFRLQPIHQQDDAQLRICALLYTHTWNKDIMFIQLFTVKSNPYIRDLVGKTNRQMQKSFYNIWRYNIGFWSKNLLQQTVLTSTLNPVMYQVQACIA